MDLFCPQCGTQLSKNTEFCQNCGAEQKDFFSESVFDPKIRSGEDNTPNKKLNIWIKIFILIILVILAIIFIGVITSDNSGELSIINSSGDHNKSASIEINDSSNTTVFYTQPLLINVRSCASVSCSILGTYPANTQFTLPYYDDSDLPQWVEISWTDFNEQNEAGYINGALLSKNPIATSTLKQEESENTQIQSGTPIKSLPAVIAKWSPSVALILCNYSNGNADSGSGFLTELNGMIVVVTNKHVITDETTGYSANDCELEIPGDGNNYYTEYGMSFEISSDGYDWGYIPVPDGDSYFNGVAAENLLVCQQQEQTGDNVIVLGYPDYAGQFDNPTATQGIISGYAEPYYTTSAQIESGNSGGVAIDPDKDCYIGIPSAVEVGNYSNLGRILNADVPFQLPY